MLPHVKLDTWHSFPDLWYSIQALDLKVFFFFFAIIMLYISALIILTFISSFGWKLWHDLKVILLPCASHKESELILPNNIFANMFG